MSKVSRIFALRHVERDKSNIEDPQTPTKGGELSAYAMGMELRCKYQPDFVDCVSSPQRRATRTADVVLAGITGWFDGPCITIREDNRLNDYSTDERPLIKEAIAHNKGYAQENGIEIELAFFLTEIGRKAIDIKASEAVGVVAELSESPGDHLLAGLHGTTIDELYLRLQKAMIDPVMSVSRGPAHGIFDKVEGFVAEFNDDGICSIEEIRQPNYLKTLATVLK